MPLTLWCSKEITFISRNHDPAAERENSKVLHSYIKILSSRFEDLFK